MDMIYLIKMINFIMIYAPFLNLKMGLMFYYQIDIMIFINLMNLAAKKIVNIQIFPLNQNI